MIYQPGRLECLLCMMYVSSLTVALRPGVTAADVVDVQHGHDSLRRNGKSEWEDTWDIVCLPSIWTCAAVYFFFKVHQWMNSLFYAHLWITEHFKRAYHRNLVRKRGKPMGELAQKGQCLQRQLVVSCVLYSRPFWWVFVVLCFWIQATLWLQWTQSWEHSFIPA